MSTRHVVGRLGAVIAVAGALSFAVPAAVSAAPFIPGSMSTCAPGAWLTFNAERVAPDRIRYTTAAPLAQWNGAVVQFTNLTTGFRGVAFVNDPVPAAVGFGPVLSEIAGLLPCFVSAGVTMS